uniref:TLC domain-containing protein n=1 Tax=Steinernema glaseri TaxID=37863 RepID=A0A1I7YIE3_9BILA
MSEAFAILPALVFFFRTVYFVADFLIQHHKPEWEFSRRRLLAVRIVSFCHALISGIMCLTTLSLNPALISDPYLSKSQLAVYLTYFSMGYFLHDFIDIFLYGEASVSKEYIIHHTLSFTGMTAILRSEQLIGLASVCLLAEVQTIFLHLRAILQLTSFGTTKFYSAVKKANLITMFLFRHCPTTYLLYYLTFDEDRAPMWLQVFLQLGLSFLFYHNVHLTTSFLRIDGYIGNEAERDLYDVVDPLGDISKKNTSNKSSQKIS